ncbi:hypothetical protein LXL04_011170 [Taraxacum kok-saghyz]
MINKYSFDAVTCIQFNPVDERYFISGSLDSKVRIWSIPDHQVVDWNDMKEMVTAASYTPDGHASIVGSYKGSCCLYDTTDKFVHESLRYFIFQICGQVYSGCECDMMIAERDAQTQVGATFVDEAEILKNVLGERRGHTKGVGRKLETVSRYPNFFKQQSAERDEINKNLLGMQKQLMEMQQYNKSLLEALRNQFPNFQPSSQPSSETSNNED